MANRRRESRMSAARPMKQVSVARERPMTVRYWKCQPYASFLQSSQHVVQNKMLASTHARLGWSTMLVQVSIFCETAGLEIFPYYLNEAEKLRRPDNWVYSENISVCSSAERMSNSHE